MHSIIESLKGSRILIADDDPRNRFALSSYLEDTGVNIYMVESGFEALEFLKDNQVDIILMDMMMPGMDGFEAIGKIRSSPGLDKVPVIAVTAQAMKGDREKCLAAGASEYVSKPINLKQLFEIAASLLKA